eukprot:108543-Amphidinium_carterae.1
MLCSRLSFWGHPDKVAAGFVSSRDGGASIGLRHEIIGGLSGSYMEVIVCRHVWIHLVLTT